MIVRVTTRFPLTMDFLHHQLARVEHNLAWVKTNDVDWKLYIQVFSWSVCLFESYLLLRQWPLYDKKEAPEALASEYQTIIYKPNAQNTRNSILLNSKRVRHMAETRLDLHSLLVS